MKGKQRLNFKRIKSIAKFFFDCLAPDSWKIIIYQGAVLHKDGLCYPALIVKLRDSDLKTVFNRENLLVLTPQKYDERHFVSVSTTVLLNGQMVERFSTGDATRTQFIDLPVGMEYASAQNFSPMPPSELSKSILMLNSVAEEALKLVLIEHKLKLNLEELRDLYNKLNNSRFSKLALSYHRSIRQIEQQLRQAKKQKARIEDIIRDFGIMIELERYQFQEDLLKSWLFRT
jgi:hypothetical protein